MKYFLDTEFIEGTQKKFFGETKPTIDLISIGIVSEDGREYYAVSKDFNLKEAWNRWQQRTGEGDRNNLEPRLYWIRENVLKPIYKEWWVLENAYSDGFQKYSDFRLSEFKRLLNKYGKSNKQIAEEIIEFCKKDDNIVYSYIEAHEKINIGRDNEYISGQWFIEHTRDNPEFYGYYSDYDWVVFCWLFGKMIDLPKGFPMYCIDLKQILDEKHNGNIKGISNLIYADDLKKHPAYPKQTNEHNALSDAIFCKNLYTFLNNLQ